MVEYENKILFESKFYVYDAGCFSESKNLYFSIKRFLKLIFILLIYSVVGFKGLFEFCVQGYLKLNFSNIQKLVG